MELDFTGNEIVATAIQEGRARLGIADDYDMDRRTHLLSVDCDIWPTLEHRQNGYGPLTTYALTKYGEWKLINELSAVEPIYCEPRGVGGWFSRRSAEEQEARAKLIAYMDAMKTMAEGMAQATKGGHDQG